MLLSHQRIAPALLLALTLVPWSARSSRAIRQHPHASELERGPVADRLETLAEFLDLPIEQPGPAFLAAVKREAARMRTFRRHPSAVSGDERDLSYEYAAGFARAPADSKEPFTIPLLIDYSSSGNAATDALARFGDVSVLQRFSGNNSVTTAMLALAIGRPDLRRRIEQLATDRDEWIRVGVVNPDSITMRQQLLQGLLNRTPAR